MDDIIKLIEALQPLLTLAGGGALTLAGVWYKDRRDRHRDVQDWFRTKYIEEGVEPLHLYLVWARRYFLAAKNATELENVSVVRDMLRKGELVHHLDAPIDEVAFEQARRDAATSPERFDAAIRNKAHQLIFQAFARKEPLYFPEQALTRISLLVDDEEVRKGFVGLAFQIGLEKLPKPEVVQAALNVADALLDAVSELHSVLQSITVRKRSDIDTVARLPAMKALLNTLHRQVETTQRTSESTKKENCAEKAMAG